MSAYKICHGLKINRKNKVRPFTLKELQADRQNAINEAKEKAKQEEEKTAREERLKLDTIFEDYCTDNTHKKSLRDEISYYRNWIKDSLGHKRLNQITGYRPPPGHTQAPPGQERKGKERKDKKILKPLSLKPEGVSESLWNDFLSNRKHKKLQNTERALKTILSSFEKGLDQYTHEEMIETYISTGMQRFDPSWSQGHA